MASMSGIGFGASMVAGAALAAVVAVGAYFTYQTVMVPDDVPDGVTMPVLSSVPPPVEQSEPAAPQTAVLETPQPDAVPETAVESSQPDTTPEPAVETAQADSAPKPAVETSQRDATPEPAVEAVPDPTPDPALITAPVPTPDAAQVPTIAPSFDVVRVEPDGSSVIAGNATPNTAVTILLDGAEIGQATADGQGNFVALLNVPSGTSAQVLSLSSLQSDGGSVASKDSVILAPVVRVEPEPVIVAQVEPEPKVTALVPATPTPTPTPPAVSAETEAPVVEPTPAAPAVLLANEEGVQVIQPAERSPEVMGNVVIDAISYDALGEVQVSGRSANQGQDSGFVRVYLNDAPIQTTPIGQEGDWHTALPNVDTGIYVLRVDQVDASGAVTSRTQTPFKRETAEVLANAQSSDPAQQISAVTVQPGSTLWAIARDKYGDGMLYVRVFEANSDSIRNPDLIYPGQVFQVPE